MLFRHGSFCESVSGEEDNRNGKREAELRNVEAGHRKRQPGIRKRESSNVKAGNRNREEGTQSRDRGVRKITGNHVKYTIPGELFLLSLLSLLSFPLLE